MAPFVGQSEFDFGVHVSTHTQVVKAGQTVAIPIVVQAIKGRPRPIVLTTSDWKSAGLTADIAPSTVPSGGVATLYVTVPAGTPPGSYMFTVRGAAEGTFKTSNDAVTLVVEPEKEKKDGEDRQSADQTVPNPGAAGSPPPAAAKRAVFSRGAKKAPARPVSPGQRALLLVVMFVMIGVLAYYVGTLLGDGFGGSDGGSTSALAGTYTGTSTFCISSVMGNAPECGTGNASIQIDGSGNVLGPGLFGKITGSSFAGEADDGNGSTFPMTGTFSNGTLTARYQSSSVTWTITVHK